MDRFDFVVVGGGSAGCVIAARLSEDDDVGVAVLEAGSRQIPPQVANDIAVPWRMALVQNTVVDWGYESVPQPHLLGRRIREPRGRMPGGTSNLYYLMHIRGHRSDYDNWAYNGCPGWSYDDVLPYFQKIEDQEDDTNPTAGKGGPLRVASVARREPNPTSQVFINACLELGFPLCEDFNGPHMEGAGWHHVNIKDGRRHCMEDAYLYPALERKNLSLVDGAQATRLLFDGQCCIGVEYYRNGKLECIGATREVVVCAGAIDSPKLLLLSGIGNSHRLAALGIPVVVDLPGVGENFHNHVLIPVVCVASKPIPAPRNNMSEAALFYKSESGWPGPDMQMGFVHGDPSQMSSSQPPNVMVMLPGLVRPLSRGWVRLASTDPLAKPLINPNYLSVDADARRLTDAVRLAREIYATRAFAEWVQIEVAPGAAVPDDRLGDYVRQAADSYHHQAGSCRMGQDSMAVVDPHLRVHGIEGLRVADASVMPAVPSGNCHAGIAMIAEKAADLIKAAHRS
jgi:choline dehydrogenase